MKTTILAGAVTAMIYSGAAMAGGTQAPCPDTHTKAQTEAMLGAKSIAGALAQAPDVMEDDDTTIIVDDPTGDDPAPNWDESEGVGGSGEGGSGEMDVTSEEIPPAVPPQSYSTDTSTNAFTPVTDTGSKKESKADMRGLTLVAGGGVEGYTFGLAPQVQPGPAWNVTAALKPTKVLGLELAYNGAANEIKSSDSINVSGADIVRNGGQAVATVGLSAAPVQPYLLGGIGVSRYNVRAPTPGFESDTVGSVPVGAGLRTHVGHFTADARLGYNFLFSQQFAGNVEESTIGAPGDTNFSNGGRYIGTLNVGTTF